MRKRTFGWIQNPSDFRNLKSIAALFVPNSTVRNNVAKEKLPILLKNGLVSQEDYDAFERFLLGSASEASYEMMKGKGGKRGIDESGLPNSKCTGLAQAVITAQKSIMLEGANGVKTKVKKPYTDDWTADGYLRWGAAVGILKYDAETDMIGATDFGKRFSESQNGSSEETALLEEAVLSYPPAVRILRIMSDGKERTKFELGKELGFVGEMGFSSVPQARYAAEIAEAKSEKEKQAIRQNEEGDSDKYVRTYISWMIKLGWFERTKKTVRETYLSKEYEAVVPAYRITVSGMNAARREKGYGKNPRVRKIICCEMLASKTPDAEFLRRRRAVALSLLKKNAPVSVENIRAAVSKTLGTEVEKETVLSDLNNLNRIGIEIEVGTEYATLKETFSKLRIPTEKTIPHKAVELKEKLRPVLKNIPEEFLELIDLAYDDSQDKSRKIVSAMKTEELSFRLMTEVMGFDGVKLGGPDKPDYSVWTKTNSLTVDSKAYSNGCSIGGKNADEMTRYVLQNEKRKPGNPKNEWWKNIPTGNRIPKYLFVTSETKPGYEKHLNGITGNTGVQGGIIGVDNLLRYAEKIAEGNADAEDFVKAVNGTEILCNP